MVEVSHCGHSAHGGRQAGLDGTDAAARKRETGLAGLWRPAPGLVGDMTRGIKSGEVVPFQPWAEALFKQRRANNSRDDPTARCIVGGVPRSDLVGYPIKILETPGMVTISTRPCTRIDRSTDGRTPRWIRIRRGSATRSGAGTATSSSSNSGSTTTSGWTTRPARDGACA